ncbi:unnamed protein product [Acanthoscelides obtectus]|uniref:Uncharacterized protein n=1 Tax=Acanthoscelides obtectus TaxID=200917 RepID=A0A9P0LQI0_ACAOB|nr:unnamed protein product [Acanthoscelides obtectus]CAK1664020.1 Farnesol dehydrogenase [Acanthoscelides obtectus]
MKKLQQSVAEPKSISPGIVSTEFENGFPEDGTREALKSVPKLVPDDIAQAVLYALSTGPNVDVTELTIRPLGEMF